MNHYLWIILGMMLVTYLPRLLPMVAMSDRLLKGPVKRFLTYIPYAALGALIIPGAVNATPDKPLASIIGVSAAAVIAWFRGGLILPVVASIGAAYLVICYL